MLEPVSGTRPVASLFADFVGHLGYDDLPPAVVEATKQLIADQLAAQIIGATMPWVAPARQLVELSRGAAGESTIVGQGWKALAADAAFVNASYGQACEYDDSTYGSAGHIGTATIPAALAIGERERVDGKNLITAIVAGYEVMFRLMASVRPHHNTRGFHSQSIGGPFAAAAVAGKILGLSAGQLTHALAIAGSHACGPLEYDQSGGEVKRIHAGLAARGGIHSALLAQFGLTGPATIIEGKRGFCQIFSTRADPSKLTTDLGQSFNIVNAWFKMFPATAPVHGAISAAEALVGQYGIRPSDIARIRVRVAETSVLHGAGIARPEDVLGAQFSLAFSVALRIVKRQSLLADYRNAALWNDPEIVALMDRIVVEADPDAKGPLSHMARMTIDLRDGSSVSRVERYPLGTPPNPASRAQKLAKVYELAGAVLSDPAIDRLIATIDALENLMDVGDLTRQLAACPGTETDEGRRHG